MRPVKEAASGQRGEQRLEAHPSGCRGKLFWPGTFVHIRGRILKVVWTVLKQRALHQITQLALGPLITPSAFVGGHTLSVDCASTDSIPRVLRAVQLPLWLSREHASRQGNLGVVPRPQAYSSHPTLPYSVHRHTNALLFQSQPLCGDQRSPTPPSLRLRATPMLSITL